MTLEKLFLQLINISINAGWLILMVVLLRICLKKAPKWVFCMLWGMVGLRLILPVSLQSTFSLLPSVQTIPRNITMEKSPSINSGIPLVDNTVNPMISGSFAPNPGDSVNPLQVVAFVSSRIWIAGLVLMLLYLFVSFYRLRRQVQTATLLEQNIYQSEFISSPFILGIIHPQIYVPYHLQPQKLFYIISHENAHLIRKDYLIKPLAYLILCVYWFHPLVWIAYILLCRDIELACDEKVIRNMDAETKKEYAYTLLHYNTQRHLITACPLAFGEVGVKERILHVKHYKKPGVWVLSATAAICIVVAVCFLTNPTDSTKHPTDHSQKTDTPVTPLGTGQTDASTKNNTTKTHTIENPPTVELAPITTLEEAISQAILDYNHSPQTQYADYVCFSFIPLETKETTYFLPFQDSLGTKLPDGIHTIYGWLFYQEFDVLTDQIGSRTGTHIPIALTFEITDGEYQLQEYWEPFDGGAVYVQSIRDKFPDDIEEIGLSSQKFFPAQYQDCYRQVVENTDLDVDAALDRLVGLVCSDRGMFMENPTPEHYKSVHLEEYRELIYFGDYTLVYCFDRFKTGNETGREGDIMAMVCKELLPDLKLPDEIQNASSGQEWFNGLQAHAGNVVEQYSE